MYMCVCVLASCPSSRRTSARKRWGSRFLFVKLIMHSKHSYTRVEYCDSVLANLYFGTLKLFCMFAARLQEVRGARGRGGGQQQAEFGLCRVPVQPAPRPRPARAGRRGDQTQTRGGAAADYGDEVEGRRGGTCHAHYGRGRTAQARCRGGIAPAGTKHGGKMGVLILRLECMCVSLCECACVHVCSCACAVCFATQSTNIGTCCLLILLLFLM